MEYDPPSKKKQDGLLDLPLGGRPPGRPSPPSERRPDKSPREPRTEGIDGGLGHSAAPRHQRRRGRRRGRKLWPLWGLLLLAVGAAAYWLFFRPPVAQADTALLEFAPTRVGRNGEQARVEVFNRGRRPLMPAAVDVVGEAGGDFSVSGDTCTGASLGPEESCAIDLAFEPQASGPRTATLELRSNASGEALSVALSGTGQAPILAAERASLDFDRIAVGKASEAMALSFANEGTAPLAIARMAVEGSGESSFVWVANGCSGETLEPGETCAVRLAFKPRDTGGFKAELRAWSDAPEDPRVGLAGLGVAPGLFILPSELDFGALRPGQRTDSRSIRLENTGNAALEIQRVELGGAGAAAFTVTANDCDGRTLAAEQSCSVAVRYQPEDPARHQAVLRVQASGLRQRREVALAGAALAPRIAIGASLLDFGQVVEYGTNESRLEIRNTGSAPLELGRIEIAGGGGAFGITDRGCPERLAAGAECVLGLRFSPSKVGAADAELRIAHDAPGSPVDVRLLGSGTALPRGAIEVEPASLDFGSLPVGERSEILTIKVRSVGGARLELGGYEIIGSGADTFRIVPASCEGLSSLLPGSDCTIGVRFRSQEGGTSRATVRIRHGAGTYEVELSGSGF